MRSTWLLVVLALAALLAGCIGSDTTPAEVAGGPAEGLPDTPTVVAAVIDTGINPYHVEFRDDSPRAFQHPSTYIDGYPEDAEALDLTLDADSYEEAVLADCEEWRAVEPGELYWIPGTKIVGAITDDDAEVSCEEDDLPHRILDRGGHGTMTASRLAGETTSLCPSCRIVAVQGFTAAHMRWAAERPWIDLQSNSWGHLPHSYGTEPGAREDARAAAEMQPTFVAGGNGLLGFFGVTGHPAYFDNIAGPHGIIMVGGHDNGRYTPWSMTMPHVVADVRGHPAAQYDAIEEPGTGGGTSGATPFVAGAFGRALLEMCREVEDLGNGVRNGSLVVAADPQAAPSDGPLADGELTIPEAKLTYYHTANPRPREGGYDGDRCRVDDPSVGCALYATTPVRWEQVPEPVPAYYFVGYGQVGNMTLPDHLAVLQGEEPIPERPMADRFYGFDQTMRRTFDGAR